MAQGKIVKWSIAFVVLVVLAVLFKLYNPLESDLFPKCPFKTLTGYRCPGCGSQTAMHYLLNFDLKSAAHANLLLILSIPYLLTGFVFDLIKNPGQKILKWRKKLFGSKAIYVVLAIIVSFWILRNLSCCQA